MYPRDKEPVPPSQRLLHGVRDGGTEGVVDRGSPEGEARDGGPVRGDVWRLRRGHEAVHEEGAVGGEPGEDALRHPCHEGMAQQDEGRGERAHHHCHGRAGHD